DAATNVPVMGNGDSGVSGAAVASRKTPIASRVFARAEPPTRITPVVPAQVPEVTDGMPRFISPPIEAPPPNPLPTAVAPASGGAGNAGGFKPLFKLLAPVAHTAPPEQPPHHGRHARAERDEGDAERLERAGGTGRALDKATRKKMEGFFGAD